MTDFDPYFQWLGIPPTDQPPDHYRLLGLPRFTNDAQAIQHSADERMAAVRMNQAGPRGRFTQKLLNELATAKLCLLNPFSKAEYDASLSSASGQGAPLVDSLLPASLSTGVPLPPPSTQPEVRGPSNLMPKVQVHPIRHRPKKRKPEYDPRMIGWWLPFLGLLAVMVVGLGVFFFRPFTTRDGAEVIKHSTKDSSDRETNQQPATVEPDRRVSLKINEESGLDVIQQEASGFISLPLSAAKRNGQVALESREVGELLVGWQSDDDSVTWQFKTQLSPPQGIYRVRLMYQAASAAAGAQFVLHFDGEEYVRDLHARDRLIEDECYVALKHKGVHTLRFSLRSKPPSAAFGLKVLELSIPRTRG